MLFLAVMAVLLIGSRFAVAQVPHEPPPTAESSATESTATESTATESTVSAAEPSAESESPDDSAPASSSTEPVGEPEAPSDPPPLEQALPGEEEVPEEEIALMPMAVRYFSVTLACVAAFTLIFVKCWRDVDSVADPDDETDDPTEDSDQSAESDDPARSEPSAAQ